MSERLKQLVTSNDFQRLILSLIVLSGVLAGMETYPAFADQTRAGTLINWLQDCILYAFVAEAVLKILSYGSRPWDYFRHGWNLFDFAIIVVCFLPINANYATVFRMARLLRTLRMVTLLPRLQVLVGALLKSIPSLGYIGILLGLHFYVYAVAGTFLFRANDPVRFGTLHQTTLTLFQVLTLEGWNDILATQYNGSDAEYPDYFLAAFGKPKRVSVCECERPLDPSLAQALHTLNGETLMTKIGDKTGRLAKLLAEKKSPEAITTEFYLATLSRPPSSAEIAAAQQIVAEAATPEEGWQDLLWALLNSKQFLFVR